MPPSQEYLSPAAKKVVQPGMTPCQQARALNQNQFSVDAVKSMAHGLPERDSVKWAALSAEKVSNPAHQPDLQAIQAAKAWAQNPTPEAQTAAAAAAAKTDFQTPGAWAAQAAAWAGKGGGLAQHAVAGAVLLAAAQAGKPISPPAVPAPKLEAPKLPAFQMPDLKKPAIPTPEVPPATTPGPDGLALTPPQRAEMAKHCDPFLQLGCDIGSGRA